MGDFNQEPSSSITWMLHSAEINDSALAEALVTEFYEGAFAFAMFLSNSVVLATTATRTAILQAVRERHRFWNETSLQAWLYRLTYLHIQKNIAQAWETTSPPHQQTWDNLPWNNSLPGIDSPNIELRAPLLFLLYYGHRLSLDEIAYVLGKETLELSLNLNQDRWQLFIANDLDNLFKGILSLFEELISPTHVDSLVQQENGELDHHLAGCPHCQAYRNKLPILEKKWKESLKPVPVEPSQIRGAIRRITASVSRKSNQHKHLLPYKEISLVITVVLLMTLFGHSQGLFEEGNSLSSPTSHPIATSHPTRTPAPTPTPAPRPHELIGYEGGDFFYFDTWTMKGDTWETIAVKASLREEVVRYLNPTLPEQLSRSTRLKLAGLKSSPLFQVTQKSQSTHDLSPLGFFSTPDEILQRARQSDQYWDTLYIDQVSIDYGPPGYRGPALQISRTHVFASQPDHWISIQAEPDRLTNVVTYAAGDWIFRRPPRSGRLSAVWMHGGFDGSSLPFTNLDLPQVGYYLNAGEDLIATRSAVILDWFNEAGWRQERMWFDALTGALLKHEIFSSPPEEIILQSFVVIEIFYDLPLPEDFFFPPSSSYLQFINKRVIDELQLGSDRFGVSPQHSVPAAKVIPPLGFDPSQNPLLLKFPFLSNVDEGARTNQIFGNSEIWDGSPSEENTQQERIIQVFSGDYYLGELELENTQFRACQRSPDGSNVALLTSIDLSRSNLSWFSLDSLEAHFVTELAGSSTEFTFSPNSQKLAFANCRMGCGVTVLDLASGDLTSPGPVYDWVSHLEWSPDGSQLAYMTSRGSLAPRIHVIDLVAGAEIHIAEFDLQTGQPLEPGSPIETWGIPYPNSQQEPGCRYP